MAKAKNPRFVTPLGVAVYPHLLKADYEYKPDGEYKTKLRLDPNASLRSAKGEDLGTMADFLEAQGAASVEKAKAENNGKIKPADLPYEEDEETGELLVNFKLKAKVTPTNGEEFTQKPAIFDSKGTPFTGERIWGGSKIKIAFECVPFYTKLIGAGITLRLKAVQIVELVETGGADASTYGFGEEEGFESEESEAESSGFSSEDDDAPEETPEQEDDGSEDF